MIEINRKVGQAIRIGRHTVRVLGIRDDKVVFALIDDEDDESACADALAAAQERLRWASEDDTLM